MGYPAQIDFVPILSTVQCSQTLLYNFIISEKSTTKVMFWNKCTIHFDKRSIIDLHLLSLVHGEKSETKCEPIICEEIFQEPNSEKLGYAKTCLRPCGW